MIELLNIDCMDFMATCSDKQFDLAIVDPPYGIGKFWSGGDSKNKGYRKNEPDWNQSIPSDSYFNELKRVSQNQIIWGWNYYTNILGSSNNLIIWDKCISYKTNYSEYEIASCSFKTVGRIIKIPLISKIKDQIDYHPCAKPVSLYKKILYGYAKPDFKIIDTHLGSGSSAIAAYDFGCDFVGCEIDKEYFDAAKKRFETYKMQTKLQFV